MSTSRKSFSLFLFCSDKAERSDKRCRSKRTLQIWLSLTLSPLTSSEICASLGYQGLEQTGYGCASSSASLNVLVHFRVPVIHPFARQNHLPDPADVVALISAVFRGYGPGQKLWSLSAATLRRRFSQLLSAVGFRTKAVNGARNF